MSRRNLNIKAQGAADYHDTVADLLGSMHVQSMRKYRQHRDVTCLEHCANVSLLSYRVCRRLGLDARAAARGGLLHDFFLYDWHTENPYGGLHGFRHPSIALKNADMHFALSDKERDIIRKHMWPLTPRPPRYPESLIVAIADKYYCVAEIFRSRRRGTHSPVSVR